MPKMGQIVVFSEAFCANEDLESRVQRGASLVDSLITNVTQNAGQETAQISHFVLLHPFQLIRLEIKLSGLHFDY